MDRKILEFDITEVEFDKYVGGNNLPILETTDDYVLYGTAFGADIKYKNVKDGDKDAFRIVQFVPEEITCGGCHIKIHTGYHDECPLCNKTLVDLIQANRKYNDTMHDFNSDLQAEFQKRQTEFNEKLMKECGFDF